MWVVDKIFLLVGQAVEVNQSHEFAKSVQIFQLDVARQNLFDPLLEETVLNSNPLCLVDPMVGVRRRCPVVLQVGLQRLELLRLADVRRCEKGWVDWNLKHPLELTVLFVEIVFHVRCEVGGLFLLFLLLLRVDRLD